MKIIVVIAVLVAVASHPSQGAEIFQQECNNYHESMMKVNKIRQRCSLPAFTDCCLPKSFVPTSHTGVYEISDVCNHVSRAFLRVPSEKMSVRCDMDTDDGGWIVIQRRVNSGTTNFSRNWDEYEQGFGDLEGEFWFGLLNIHCLTTREEVELRIDMQNAGGTKATWTYQEFQVDGPEDDYLLHIGEGEGTTGTFDAMARHHNSSFSTYDRDNDRYIGQCASVQRGGWWFNRCYHSNLNGIHSRSHLRWRTSSLGHYFYPSNVEMKVRPKACKLV